jgi:hypothetical protein
MKIELLFLAVGAFLIVDSTHDHKYTKMLSQSKKHFKTAGIVFGLFSLYLFFKKNPAESTSMMSCVNGLIKFMPIDKESKDMITPIFHHYQPKVDPRIEKSGGGDGVGGGSTVRSVSGTKKKYVAASQDWKCGTCRSKLDAWFEVDHKQRLADGGSNHIDNLIALCRNCHGKKTFLENM